VKSVTLVSGALLSLLSSVLIAGCASSTPTTVASAAPAASEAAGVVCTRETPTGTHFAVTRCRTQEQIERDRAEAAKVGDMIRSQQQGPRDK